MGQQTPPKIAEPDVDSQLCVEGQTLDPDPLGEQSILRSPLLSLSGSPALHKTERNTRCYLHISNEILEHIFQTTINDILIFENK